jgi:hypothetical protein
MLHSLASGSFDTERHALIKHSDFKSATPCRCSSPPCSSVLALALSLMGRQRKVLLERSLEQCHGPHLNCQPTSHPRPGRRGASHGQPSPCSATGAVGRHPSEAQSLVSCRTVRSFRLGATCACRRPPCDCLCGWPHNAAQLLRCYFYPSCTAHLCGWPHNAAQLLRCYFYPSCTACT